MFLGVLFVVKLAMMWQSPLHDPSESRYAEMARKMVETGDWITPQFDYGVPFWGKPPLSTWFSALGIQLLGDSMFAARLPILLVSLWVLWIMYQWVKDLRGEDAALLSTAVLACIPIFNYLTGTVMTDMCLGACTTLTMVSFFRVLTTDKKSHFWKYMFFVSIGLGLLAKGPAATVLAGLPIFGWVVINNKWKEIWQRFPWIIGSLVALCIALPWYVLAELKTPGFINYFIVGEHLSRFVVSGWKGDLYGSAHHEPIGSVWIFWLLTAIPWSLVMMACGYYYLRAKKSEWSSNRKELLSYLLCWTVAPLVFFTMAQNIIPTYVFTGITALPFLLIETVLIVKSRMAPKLVKFLPTGTAICCALMLGLFLGVWISTTYFPDSCPKTSQMQEVALFKQQAGESSGLYYWKKRLYSAEFYTQGAAKTIATDEELNAMLSNGHQDFLVIRKKSQLLEDQGQHFSVVHSFSKHLLLKEKSAL